MAVKLNEEDDFGFSLVSEAELKTIESQLAEELAQQQKTAAEKAAEAAQLAQTVQTTNMQAQAKLDGLVKMITPLINNLMLDPTKEYVYWPDRAAKMKAFKAKLDAYLKQ